ncbi:MAG: fibronectin type III domain-containing protein, partial [Gemmatimonadota bacterium]|nr:fibronectin type III domain-containing protein [Gemmatimonadota bacterium]
SPVSLLVSWNPPAHLGPDGAVDDYDVRWYQGTADPADEADWTEESETGAAPDPRTNTAVEISGLRPNTAYRVQVRAHGGEESDWSRSGTATTQMAVADSRFLVSNIDATDHATLIADLGDFDFAQDFWTPGYAGGYLLESVEVRFSTAPSDPNSIQVLLRARGDTGFGPVLATLKNPASIVVESGRLGGNTFTAPAGTILDPNTRYYVIVRGRDSGATLKTKAARGANCGPADAWCVGPTRYHFANGRTDRE